jgi:ribose transport system substrate-binding protein
MRNIYRLKIVIGLFFAALLMVLCTRGDFIDLLHVPTKQCFIGATYTSLSDPFYEVINDEIQLQIKSKGDILITRDPRGDQERQNQEIEDMLDMGIQLLILNPVDYEGVVPALKKAKERNVPVILIDSKVNDDRLITCMITSNNYGAGLLDARHLISQTKEANIALLFNSESFSSKDRLSGFTHTLVQSGNAYTFLERRDCGGQLDRAMQAMNELIEKYPKIDAVMAVNDQAALGAMAALEEKGMLSSTLVYSIDGSPEAKTLIADGLMTATSAQSPFRVGKMAAEVVYEILEGRPFLTNIVVPVTQITAEDIQRFGTEGWQ